MPEPVTRDDVQRLVADEQAQLVEVLPPAEFAAEHIAGAVNVPLRELRDGARRLDRDRPVVTYCHDSL